MINFYCEWNEENCETLKKWGVDLNFHVEEKIKNTGADLMKKVLG